MRTPTDDTLAVWITHHRCQSLLSVNHLLDQGVTILTASRRLAHALRLGYARHAQGKGQVVWQTPRVLPWSTWLRQQHLEARAAHSSKSYALTPAQARVLWDDVVGSSRFAAELLNPSSAARLAARSWRRLQDYLIPIERLAEFDAPEPMALHAWCEQFTQRCASLDAVDEARLAHWAYDDELMPAERLAFAGFDAMPPAMSRLLTRWGDAGLVADSQLEVHTPASVAVIAAPDLDEELQLAASWARDRVLDGAVNVGVIVPDLQARRDAVQRVFEDAIAPGQRQTHRAAASLPVVIAAPVPMSSYPLVDAALLVLRMAAGNASSIDAGRILRSPFLAGSQTEQARRAIADVRLRDEQRDRWDWFSLERWAGLTNCDQLQLAARNLNTLLREFHSSALPSEWAERFHKMWVAIGWPGERSLSSAEHQTLEKFQSALAEFGGLDAVAGRMNLRRATARLQDLLGDTPFEPETIAAAVTVIDAATSAGMQFDALWVAGLHADRWPAAVNPDPLIPLELQRAAGIPESSAPAILHQATTQLLRWMTSADSLVLSWPHRDGDVELIRSPLLDRVEATEASLPPSVRTRSLRRTIFDARPVLDGIVDDRAPSLSLQATRGGARTLELQSRCPFRAQAELRLRARPIPRVSIGVEPVDRGAILHRVLEDVWGSLRTQERLLSVDDHALESQVRESAQRHAAQALLPDTPHRHRLAMLEIDSVVQQIMQLLRQERLRPPFAVRLAEAAEQYAIGGLSITLRPDRIDDLAAGGELLIDYKLGAAHRPRDWFDAWPGRPRRPQLPLYALAHADRLRALAYVVLAPGAVEYRGWSDGTDVGAGVVAYPKGMRIDLGDPVDWESLMHHWRFTLTRLAEHYVAGDASVDPLPQECATCHLSTLCRIHERVMNEREGEAGNDD